jgi:Arc/MetJ family transcription regulator
MKTTLNIDDAILKKASRLTGVREKTTLVRMGLEALVAHQSAKRLAALGGSEPSALRIPRRRTA